MHMTVSHYEHISADLFAMPFPCLYACLPSSIGLHAQFAQPFVIFQLELDS